MHVLWESSAYCLFAKGMWFELHVLLLWFVRCKNKTWMQYYLHLCCAPYINRWKFLFIVVLEHEWGVLPTCIYWWRSPERSWWKWCWKQTRKCTCILAFFSIYFWSRASGKASLQLSTQTWRPSLCAFFLDRVMESQPLVFVGSWLRLSTGNFCSSSNRVRVPLLSRVPVTFPLRA
jgi:hypothetical protein